MGRVKVVGYAQKQIFSNGIEYRNFTDDLVGHQQVTSTEQGLPYSLSNIFDIEINTDSRVSKNFITNPFTSFMTLSDINLSDINVDYAFSDDNGLRLNLDKTKLSNYATFGSLREFLRVTLENIILTWPAAIYLNHIANDGTSLNTVEDFNYDIVNDVSTFKVNVDYFNNPYNVDYLSNGNELSGLTNYRSLTLSYSDSILTMGDYDIYVSGDTNNIIGFTGATALTSTYTYFKVSGNPFPTISGGSTTGMIDYHIRPNQYKIETFFNGLNDFEAYILNRYSVPKYKSIFNLKMIHDEGFIVYGTKSFIWPVSDGYNLDFQTTKYIKFATDLISLAEEHDETQSNIITRLLVARSITEFDSIPTCDGSTVEGEGQKIDKLLKIYGREYDEIKRHIDGIAFAHSVSYDKKDNIPDALVKQLAYSLGWELTNSIINNESILSYLSTESTYSGTSTGLSSLQAEIEFWRRLILNTPWLWRSKGTRKSVEFILKMIGTPIGLVDFNEYIYVVKNPIDMDLFREIYYLTYNNYDISNIPISSDGFPKPLRNTRNMYFQQSGMWYRETSGQNSNIEKLTGNNPHIGPYDSGSSYLKQFECLIPDFEPVTIIQETTETVTTNLFTNYNMGTFNDIFSYDAIAYCSNQFNGQLLYQDAIKYCFVHEISQYSPDINKCTFSGDWSINLYVDDNLAYSGSIFYQSSGNTDYPSSLLYYNELENAATSLGLTISFVDNQILFVQRAGFQLCENPNLIGLKFDVELKIDISAVCSGPYSGGCDLSQFICESIFEEYGTNQEIYVDVYDINNQSLDDCYEIITEGIIDPFPTPEITDCGCDESGCDNALKICIKEKPIYENNLTDCGITGFELAETGYVIFNLSGRTSEYIQPECCESLNFTPVYERGNWKCRWDDSQFENDKCDDLIIDNINPNGLVTFLNNGLEQINVDAECCRYFGFTPILISKDGIYNCYIKIR